MNKSAQRSICGEHHLRETNPNEPPVQPDASQLGGAGPAPRVPQRDDAQGVLRQPQPEPHHETFRTTIQPPYSSTKGYLPTLSGVLLEVDQ